MDTNYQGCFIGESCNDVEFSMPSGNRPLSRILEWLLQAARLPGKGPLATALMILAKSIQLERHEHILLMPRTLKIHALNRVTAYRALEQLEEAGLVKVYRQHGRSPTVTLLGLQGDQSPVETD